MSTTNPNHPKALAAADEARRNQEVRAALMEKRQSWRKEIQHAKEAHGVRFLRVNDMTICYRTDKHDVIELSTALRNPTDQYNKIDGQHLALVRFASNNRILIRRPKHQRKVHPSVSKYLSVLFSF